MAIQLWSFKIWGKTNHVFLIVFVCLPDLEGHFYLLCPSAKYSASGIDAISLRGRQNGQGLNKQIHYGNSDYGV